jgi:hypothetical protein
MENPESSIDIKVVSYGMTIGDNKFGNSRPGVVEASIKNGRTLEEALDELDERLNCWHRKRYPTLYQETKPLEFVPQNPESYRQTDRFMPEVVRDIPIISKDSDNHNETLELIQNAPDMEALLSFKLLANNNAILYAAYCERLKYLLAP